jgi:hypothetical protein
MPPVDQSLRLAHCRVWRRWRRYCTCGIRWATCPDRRLAALPVPDPPSPAERSPAWAGPTLIDWYRAAELITPAAEYRMGRITRTRP